MSVNPRTADEIQGDSREGSSVDLRKVRDQFTSYLKTKASTECRTCRGKGSLNLSVQNLSVHRHGKSPARKLCHSCRGLGLVSAGHVYGRCSDDVQLMK